MRIEKWIVQVSRHVKHRQKTGPVLLPSTDRCLSHLSSRSFCLFCTRYCFPPGTDPRSVRFSVLRCTRWHYCQLPCPVSEADVVTCCWRRRVITLSVSRRVPNCSRYGSFHKAWVDGASTPPEAQVLKIQQQQSS